MFAQLKTRLVDVLILALLGGVAFGAFHLHLRWQRHNQLVDALIEVLERQNGSPTDNRSE